MMFGCAISASPVANPELPCVRSGYADDPRLGALRRFFAHGDRPAQHLGVDFLRAADAYKLDWRLLPSISLVESGGGREARNNNMFGWNNGDTSFATMDAGIHVVASRLAHSKLYRDKELDGILRTYNPDARYARVVKSVMARISPAE
ncbi:MAG: hypothetical protein ACRD96_28100 [Bryobacteraceae bacterium]